jgi:8-oxo-dGTP pyrophosphatase MutT (NUDIX family)
MRRRSLADLLRRYAPADPREALSRDGMIALLEAEGAFDREHFVPGHFTASAFVLSPERDAVLFIFHKKLSLWLQPGGHIEPGDESLLGAARREVAEEVGLHDLPHVALDGSLFDIDIHSIPARRDEPAHEHFDVRFLFQASSLDFRASDEVAGARWVPLGEIAAMTNDESLRRPGRKLGANTREK